MISEGEIFVHPSSVIDAGATVASGTKIWHFCHISDGASIGRDCVLGQNVFIAPGVVLGDRVRVQNNVSLYGGVVVEDDVFLGPSVVLTNVKRPRAGLAVGRANYVSTLLRRGATVGANATVVCGVTVGLHAFVGAGAVVTQDVLDHVVVVGNPARPIGLMCCCGATLVQPPSGELVCSDCDRRFHGTVGTGLTEALGS